MRYLFLLVLVLSVAPAQAAILWEQLPEVGAQAWVDQEFPDSPGYSSYQVHDVIVGANGWTINSITGFFTTLNNLWPASAPVRVNLFPKAGSLPGAIADPTAGFVGTAALTDDGSTISATLSGLNAFLGPGDYWIGLTPILPVDPYGQEFHQAAAAGLGEQSAFRNPGGAFGFGTDWRSLGDIAGVPRDGALRIEGSVVGVVPEPSVLVLLAGGLGALALFRRRK